MTNVRKSVPQGKIKFTYDLFMKILRIEIMINKARHNMIDAKCRWRSNRLDGAVSLRKPLDQPIVMQICQRETQNHQGPFWTFFSKKKASFLWVQGRKCGTKNEFQFSIWNCFLILIK